MLRHLVEVIGAAGLVPFLVVSAFAQGYDPSCQVHTITHLSTQISAVCGGGAVGCQELKQYLQQSNRYLEQGSVLNGELKQVESKVPQDPQATQQYNQLIKQARTGLNWTSPAEVRAAQKKIEQYVGIFNLTRDKQVYSNPEYDKKSAAVARFQIASDLNEREAVIKGVLVGLPEGTNRQQQITDAANAVAERLHLGANAREALLKTEGLAAYAVATSIAESGNVDEKYRMGMTPFDTGADISAQVQADHLVAGMAFDRIGDSWGGSPDRAGLRHSMGPDTRAADSAQGAIALLGSDKILQTQKIIREEVPVPQVKEATPSQVQRIIEEGKKGFEKAVERAKIKVWGPYIIKN